MDPTQERAPLERVADAFDAITTERGWGQPPLLLRVEGDLDTGCDLDLGVKELDGHPAQALLGFSAPMAWTALGVSAEGWATPCADVPHGYRAEAPAGASTRERVRSLVLLGHRGDPVGWLHWKDGRRHAEPPTEGLLVDCLRRALGRPTPPPAASTDVLFATMWLENLLERSRPQRKRHGGRSLEWEEAAALHPAVQMLAATGQGALDDDLVDTARALGRVCDWAMVRHQAIRGWKAGLDASLAVWMDAGMVSRWLLDCRPGLTELLGHLESTCSRSLARQVRQTLVGFGVDHPAAASPAA